jgi:hypothetical protein
MSLVTQYDPGGLAAALPQIGSVLGQALQQRGRQQKITKTGTLFQEALQSAQAKGPIDSNAFSTILSTVLEKGGDPTTLKMFLENYSPQIKAASYADVTKNRRERYQPIKKNGPQSISPSPDGKVPKGALFEQTKDPELSPIEKIRTFKPTEFEESESIVETPAGILRTADFIDTPFGKYHPNEVQEMLNSPNPAEQKEAQLIYTSIADQEKLKGKEAAEIRKEWRRDIKEFNKPFDDVPKTKGSIKQLERAKKLISSGKVSLDDNWMRNAIVAALEDKGVSQVAELAKTSEQRELYSIIYNFLNSKGLGGSNPSTREVMLSLAAKPSFLKGNVENLRILDELLGEQHTNLARGEIANELLQKEGPISFSRYKMEMNRLVDERMKKVNEKLDQENKLTNAKTMVSNKPPPPNHVWMMAPDGQVYPIPLSSVKEMQSKEGGIIL